MKAAIHRFNIESYENVLALWKRCAGVGLSDADSPQSIHAYLDRNPGMSFVAKVDGSTVGSILGGHDGRRGYIHHLAVDTAWRRQGIARRLVETCIHALKEAGIQKTHIFIFNSNANGIAFWKSVGWTHRSDISVISKTI
ncbi:MAG: GNAT family N-acetyltransferase [Deltaproteobacteria bacterium]|nr:GNAT family N-acetyltransferase [Deltaproteobacteria bacterium]